MRIAGESLTQNRLKNQPDNKPKNNQGYSHIEELVTGFFLEGCSKRFLEIQYFCALINRRENSVTT